MRTNRPTRQEWIVIALEILLAVGAYFGAAAMITNGLDFGDLPDYLPWNSLPLAGTALLVVNGIFPTIVFVQAIRRPGTMRTWHILVGLALVGWMVMQVTVIGFGHSLQLIYFVWGAVATFLAWRLPAPAEANRDLLGP